MSDLAGEAGPDEDIMGGPVGSEPASLWISWSSPVTRVRTCSTTEPPSLLGAPHPKEPPLFSGEVFKLQHVRSSVIRFSFKVRKGSVQGSESGDPVTICDQKLSLSEPSLPRVHSGKNSNPYPRIVVICQHSPHGQRVCGVPVE